MGFRHILRVLARSRSLRFTIDAAQARRLALSGVRGKPWAKLRWRGHDIFYRPATSDPLAIYQVLLRRGKKAEYYLPPALEPKDPGHRKQYWCVHSLLSRAVSNRKNLRLRAAS